MSHPSVRRKPTALSLFSGAGGMDMGVSWAGFNILASVEIDPHCCDTLRTWIERENHRAKVVQGDITLIDPANLMQSLGVSPGELDLLFGGPPCQAFSQIGAQKGLADSRGMLLFQIARFAEVFKPKAILIEQVKGILSVEDERGKKGGVFEQLLVGFRTIGYEPKWQVLSAADYGVPQLRQRVFIVATQGQNAFTFPLPTHSSNSEISDLFATKTYRTVGEVLKGLPRPVVANGETGQPEVPNHIDVTPKGDRRRIKGVPEGGWLAAQLHLPVEQRQALTRKDTTKFRRLSRREPSLTLRCGEIFFHPTQDRYLTPREYLRLHGYPDDYVLKGPIRSRSGRVRLLDQHRQVANSVPPPLAYCLADKIREALACRNSSRFSATR